MGLKVYNADRTETAEIVSAHNGVIGESVDILLYLRNDDAGLYYDNIQITTADHDGNDDTIGVYGTGRGFKLVEGARQPTESEWDNVLAGDFIEMPQIGGSSQADTTTYFPFWVRVIVPGNTEAQTFDDVTLEVTASEHTVGV